VEEQPSAPYVPFEDLEDELEDNKLGQIKQALAAIIPIVQSSTLKDKTSSEII
jgi:hypothetical protein